MNKKLKIENKIKTGLDLCTKILFVINLLQVAWVRSTQNVKKKFKKTK